MEETEIIYPEQSRNRVGFTSRRSVGRVWQSVDVILSQKTKENYFDHLIQARGAESFFFILWRIAIRGGFVYTYIQSKVEELLENSNVLHTISLDLFPIFHMITKLSVARVLNGIVSFDLHALLPFVRRLPVLQSHYPLPIYHPFYAKISNCSIFSSSREGVMCLSIHGRAKGEGRAKGRRAPRGNLGHPQANCRHPPPPAILLAPRAQKCVAWWRRRRHNWPLATLFFIDECLG